jgi:hypothetical protein
MSKKRDSMLHTFFIKKDKGIEFANKYDAKAYKYFLDSLSEGQVFEVFLDAQRDDGILAQLAKIHKCIREIAHHTGNSFEDIKLEVKKKAGLCIKKNIDGELFMICKSFGDSSKEELSLAIRTIEELGDFVGANLR